MPRAVRELPRSPDRSSAPIDFFTSSTAGTSPNTIVIAAISPSASASTRPLMAASARRGTSTGNVALMSGRPM